MKQFEINKTVKAIQAGQSIIPSELLKLLMAQGHGEQVSEIMDEVQSAWSYNPQMIPGCGLGHIQFYNNTDEEGIQSDEMSMFVYAPTPHSDSEPSYRIELDSFESYHYTRNEGTLKSVSGWLMVATFSDYKLILNEIRSREFGVYQTSEICSKDINPLSLNSYLKPIKGFLDTLTMYYPEHKKIISNH